MNQQDKSFLTTFTTVIAVLVMLAVAIFMVSRLVAVMAAKPDDGSRRLATLTKRIAPIGEVAVAGMPAPSTADSAETTSPAPAAPQQVAAAGAASGEAVYNQACAACHTAGVLNAPKLGSKEQWETRYAQGLDTLVTHAVNGINAMPAKGGHPALTEAEIEASVVYMLEGSGIEVAEATTEVAAAPTEPAAAPTTAPAQQPEAPTTAPAQQSEAPAQTAAAPAVTSATPAPEAPAAAPEQTGASSVREVTLAASEAASASSQAAAAASQAASAASQAAAAASQAAAAVSQAIDMLREMAVEPTAAPAAEPTAPEPVPAPAPAPQSEAEPATSTSATSSGKPIAPAAPVAKPAAKATPPAKPAMAEPPAEKPAVPQAEATPAPASAKPQVSESKQAKPATPPAETKPAPAPTAKPQEPESKEGKPAAPQAEAVPAQQTKSAPAAKAAPEQTAAVSPEPSAAEPAEIEVVIPPDIHLGQGKQLYNTACVICHQAGVAGAPKLGDKAAWGPRLGQGFDKLVEHSLKGYKGMPPKGGRLDVPDEEIISAVGYMLSELE